jgi:hypothetical protein
MKLFKIINIFLSEEELRFFYGAGFSDNCTRFLPDMNPTITRQELITYDINYIAQYVDGVIYTKVHFNDEFYLNDQYQNVKREEDYNLAHMYQIHTIGIANTAYLALHDICQKRRDFYLQFFNKMKNNIIDTY